MECNKDEAQRAKQIAENKMQNGDFVGAMKFAMKAQKLFPETHNITQILTVCEVHCAAHNKLSESDMDWYGILLTERFSDETTIKKQYRKLALLLHPDKNKSAGAEAAFKLIGEANRVLSDQTKRSAYDMKIRVLVGTTAPKVLTHASNSSSFVVQQQTFWTSCPHCNTRYQYYKTMVNANLRCQQCQKSFTARQMGYSGAPLGNTWSPSVNHNDPPKHVPPREASKGNGGKACGKGQEDKFASPVSMAKCAAGDGVPCKVRKSKDGREAAGATKGVAGTTKAGVGTSNPATSKAKESKPPTDVGSKRPRQSAENDNYMKAGNVEENGVDPSGLSGGVHTRRSSRNKQNVSYAETAGDGDFERSSKRPRQEESFNTTKVSKEEVPASGGIPPSEEKISRNKTEIEQLNLQRKEASKSDIDDRKSNTNKLSPPKSNLPPSFELDCPDPDFSDFEKDKAEDCFADNQFWAIYDNTDCMPRFYAVIRKVYSPLKLQFYWLEPDPDDEGEIKWDDAGLPVACGKYALGGLEKTENLAMFSHQVHCIKRIGKHYFLVYPKKGETWAIFRDWDIGWSSDPNKHSEYQFEYVEVLSDFGENDGVKVTYLGKVKGFVSIFQQTVQNGISVFCIPPNELYRFSHQIPSFKMTGDEREGVPRGSFELDPAGLPLSLLEAGDPGDVKMKDGMVNNAVNCSGQGQESSKCKVEQAMANESVCKQKLRDSNGAERVAPIIRRSPRSNAKSMDNIQAGNSEYIVREDNKSQPVGTEAAGCQTNEDFRTPQKHEKKNYDREILEVRRSPRHLRSKNGK